MPNVSFYGCMPSFTGMDSLFAFLTFDNDGFQVFRSHDGSHTGAPGGMVPVRHDAPEQYAVFSSRTNGHDLQFVTAQLLFEGFIGLPCIQPPNRFSTADFYRITVNIKIDRLGRFATKNQTLNAAGLQNRCPKPPPTFELPNSPVSGDRALTCSLDEVGAAVPVSNPQENIKIFSGPSGSTPAGRLACKNWTLKPRPPRCFHTRSSGMAKI